MEQVRRLTAVTELDDDVYVALCPEFDIASQGANIEEARTNLIEALTLFFETPDHEEIQLRGRSGVFVTQVEVPVG
jgi:predicted RNase H-like HicB family nuclease